MYAFHHHGYDAYGVDFAKETVAKTNASVPDLNVFPADVKHLPFRSSTFDGYWSLGVIEHFYEGYEDILNEMTRVVKKGGYVFLTFPYMSPLRKIKATLGLYKRYDNNINVPDFYQFALAAKAVQDDFEKHGFILQYSNPFDGLKGFKDEVLIFKPILQKLYDYNGRSSLVHRLRNELTIHLARFSAHMILMIFQQTAE